MRTNDRGIVDVRLRGDAGLPDEGLVVDGWNNPYYLTPLVSLCKDLTRGAR